MGKELLILGIVLAVLATLVILLRRAGERSQEREPEGVKDRLRDVVAREEEAQIAPRRRRDRVKPSTGHKRDLAAAKDREARAEREARRRAKEEVEEDEGEEEEQEEEQDEVELKPADAETKAAFKAGLAKTRGGFVAKLGKLFGRKKIDQDVLPALEEVLFTADIGPRAADRIFQDVKSNLKRDQLSDPAAIWKQIRRTSATMLEVGAPPVDFAKHKPFVLLVIGVNGVGKTTTIGKLAAMLTKRDHKKVLLAAGDTFRAAATEQLEIWADRAGCDIVKGKAGTDPSSVIFDAISRGVKEEYDVVIADTAGRLQTKTELMEELKKVRRVSEKAMPGCPHETWLVLDATTGQNAIQQAKIFKEAMEITGLVLTKLDGSAKGGVILGICDELKVPVRYVGIGEKVEDLRSFDTAAFVEALYDDAEEAA